MPELLAILAGAFALAAAPTPEPVPESSRRPVTVDLEARRAPAKAPSADLAEGFRLETVAESPLVTHPIMACLGPDRTLFVADAVGVNWNKAQLEAAPPNRILHLRDLDGDGRFDRSTVFADGLTFPQGALWHRGSLYVCTPPGLMRLTDIDGDGIADRRETLVSGFEYTGNAADVHGPFLHGDRLYFCHGRKGHKATDRDGKVVHAGMAAGVWRCDLEGRGLEWFTLGAGDNPVEVVFGPRGEAFATYNLYYGQPRGDTVIHLQPGAVHPRADQPQVTADEPRTVARHPVLHNFGHVAVSGTTLWRRSAPFDGDGTPLQMMVTHFNTGRLVRLAIVRAADGSGWRATEHEFLRIKEEDVHLTDVIEDEDGSLLVLDTGGWFRIGCPSSLVAKPEALGRIHRIRPIKPLEAGAAWRTARHDAFDPLGDLRSGDPIRVRAACEALTDAKRVTEHPDAAKAMLRLLSEPLPAEAEHALLHALQRNGIASSEPLDTGRDATALRRLIIIRAPVPSEASAEVLTLSEKLADASDVALAAVAREVLLAQKTYRPSTADHVRGWLRQSAPSGPSLEAAGALSRGLLRFPEARDLVTLMLTHPAPAVRAEGLRTLSEQLAGAKDPAWLPHLSAELERAPSAMTIEAARKLRDTLLDRPLGLVASDVTKPMPLRLKALEAMTARKSDDATFTLLLAALNDAASAGARIQAARMIGAGTPSAAQTGKLAEAMAVVGSLELRELSPLFRRLKPAEATVLAEALIRNPALGALQESVLRTHFQTLPPALFEKTVLPALRKADREMQSKKGRIDLVARTAAQGSPERGRALFAAGRGSCVACHKVGDVGRAIGPDLSRIGAIRGLRDLTESVLLPSSTLARDYEAHVIETRDGAAVTGVIRGHVAEGLLVVDLAGQEQVVAHDRIVSDTRLEQSLMPVGLDAAFSESEFADLLAWLSSLR